MFAILGALSVSSCKSKSPASNTKDNALGAQRDQGQNGSCWIHSMGSALNSTLLRMNTRLVLTKMGMKLGSPLNFAILDDKGTPLTTSDYYQRYLKYGGMFPTTDLEFIRRAHSKTLSDSDEFQSVSGVTAYAKTADHARQVPFLSINALIYGHYLKAFRDWMNSSWPTAYNANSGNANYFNQIYPYALMPADLFADSDSFTSDSSVAQAICAGEEDCSSGSIKDLVNKSGVSKKSASGQQMFFESVIEKPFNVPLQFRTTVKDNKLHYPILEDDFTYKHGAKTYNRSNIASAFNLPKDIEMTRWHNADKGAASTANRAFFSKWSSSGMIYPDGKAMAEIVAALSILNQPVAVGLDSFSLLKNEQGDYEWSKKGSGSHGLTSLTYKVRAGELGLVLRNSWGESAQNVYAFKLTEDETWNVEMPGFLVDQIAMIFKSVISTDCSTINDEVRAFGAAYIYLNRHDQYKDFSTLGKKMMSYMDNCGGIIKEPKSP